MPSSPDVFMRPQSQDEGAKGGCGPQRPRLNERSQLGKLIGMRLYECRQRRICEVERLGITVEEWALLGSSQPTPLRQQNSVHCYFWHQQLSHVSMVTSLGLPVALPLRFHPLLGITLIYKASEPHLNPLYERQRVHCDVLRMQGNFILFKTIFIIIACI